jgi:protein-tyrosine phosphatase
MMEVLGLRWRRYPVLDGQPPTHAQLAAMIAWLDGDTDPAADQALFVHCRAGVTRTPTVAMALLMHHGLTLTEAHRRVFAARPEVTPTVPQLAWLAEVEARVRGTGRA